MQKRFKKTLLIFIVTLLMSAQSYSFYASFKSALASNFSWAKSSGNSIIASSCASLKNCAVPALVGLGFLTTVAFTADYINNKQELDLLTDLKNQLHKQRADKKLAAVELSKKQREQLAYSELSQLRKLIADYNGAVYGKISAKLVFDTYEHDTAEKQKFALIGSISRIEKIYEALLKDPRCQLKVGAEHGRSGPICIELEKFLPVPSVSPNMNLEQAGKAYEELGRRIQECKTHVQGLTYINLKLDNPVHEYLIQLDEHAKAVIENIKKLKLTQNEVNKHGQQFDNKYKDVVVNYDVLVDHLEAQISKAQKARAHYRKRAWQVPAFVCAMAAIAKASYALTKLAFKGN